MRDADLIVHGTILAGVDGRPRAAVAVGAGHVLAMGTERQADRARGPRTSIWRLRPGQVVAPGFVDAHAHLAMDAWRDTWTDLGGCRSLQEAIDRLRRAAKAGPDDGWIVARGWDESGWPERRYLVRRDLDAVSRRPVLANRVDGHMCVANSAALRRAGITANDAGAEFDARGRLTGVLKERAAAKARAAMPGPGDDAYPDLLASAIRRLHRLGVTSVHDIVHAPHIRAYQALRRQDRLTLRAYLLPYDDLLDPLLASGLRTGYGDPWLRLGAIKVFADGSLGARTAALHGRYADGRGTGQLLRRRTALRRLVARAHGAGFQLAIHAIGDRGIDAAVDALAWALERDPREDARHRIEHAELPTAEALDRIEDLGLVLSMQPNFVDRWSRPGGMYAQRLGDGRLAGNNPFRDILRRGIPLAFGSDGMPYGPLAGLAGAIEAPFPSQRLRPLPAIRAYAAGGAFAGFAERQVGALTPGAFADFVVLSADPRTTLLRDVRVDATVVGGEVVYRRPRRSARRAP